MQAGSVHCGGWIPGSVVIAVRSTKKISEYLFDNQVKKVITEDLVLAVAISQA